MTHDEKIYGDLGRTLRRREKQHPIRRRFLFVLVFLAYARGMIVEPDDGRMRTLARINR